MKTRKKARTPSYRHHKATGQAVVSLNGRDHYIGRHGSAASHAEYDRLIAEWLGNGRRLPDRQHGQDAYTIVEAIAAYLRFCHTYYVRADGSPTNEPVNASLALRPLKRLYGRTEAQAFGPLALKTVRQAMIDDDLSRAEVNKRVNHIRRMFKWCVGEELVTPSVLHGLQAVNGLRAGRTEAREIEPVKPVPMADVDAIMPHVSQPLRALILLQRYTACRPGEAVRMCARDLDMSGSVWTYQPVQHKTAYRGRSRVIYLGPRAQRVVEPFLAGRAVDAPLFSPREAEAERHAQAATHRRKDQRPNPKKSGREVGDCYSVQSYGRAIVYACDAAFPAPAGLTAQEVKAWRIEHRWSPNQLRHLAATELRRTHGLELASLVLGHSSAVLTDGVYAERDERKVLAVIERVG